MSMSTRSHEAGRVGLEVKDWSQSIGSPDSFSSSLSLDDLGTDSITEVGMESSLEARIIEICLILKITRSQFVEAMSNPQLAQELMSQAARSGLDRLWNIGKVISPGILTILAACGTVINPNPTFNSNPQSATTRPDSQPPATQQSVPAASNSTPLYGYPNGGTTNQNLKILPVPAAPPTEKSKYPTAEVKKVSSVYIINRTGEVLKIEYNGGTIQVADNDSVSIGIASYLDYKPRSAQGNFPLRFDQNSISKSGSAGVIVNKNSIVVPTATN